MWKRAVVQHRCLSKEAATLDVELIYRMRRLFWLLCILWAGCSPAKLDLNETVWTNQERDHYTMWHFFGNRAECEDGSDHYFGSVKVLRATPDEIEFDFYPDSYKDRVFPKERITVKSLPESKLRVTRPGRPPQELKAGHM